MAEVYSRCPIQRSTAFAFTFLQPFKKHHRAVQMPLQIRPRVPGGLFRVVAAIVRHGGGGRLHTSPQRPEFLPQLARQQDSEGHGRGPPLHIEPLPLRVREADTARWRAGEGGLEVI